MLDTLPPVTELLERGHRFVSAGAIEPFCRDLEEKLGNAYHDQQRGLEPFARVDAKVVYIMGHPDKPENVVLGIGQNQIVYKKKGYGLEIGILLDGPMKGWTVGRTPAMRPSGLFVAGRKIRGYSNLEIGVRLPFFLLNKYGICEPEKIIVHRGFVWKKGEVEIFRLLGLDHELAGTF